jgi:hypothetical protein
VRAGLVEGFDSALADYLVHGKAAAENLRCQQGDEEEEEVHA